MFAAALTLLVVQQAAAAEVAPQAPRIPQLELARERWAIVDREAGQYLGHPSTVLLGDGKTLLCAYPKGHGKGEILLKRSDDGGATWSERLPTPANWATSQETPTLFRVGRADGGARLLLFSGLHPIRQAHSDDEGRTWSELAPLGDWGGIVAMASLEQFADGRLLAFFHDDGRFIGAAHAPHDGRKFHVYVSESKDCGTSWSAPRAIASRADADLCEPGVVRSPDGARLVALLRENRRKFRSFFTLSSDEGATWSEPRELAPELTGDRHVARYAADGRLVISFRDMLAGSASQGDWILWVGAFDDVLEGRAGAYRVRLGDSHSPWDAAYPGLERLPGGEFVCTTYGHWDAGEKPYVVSARFTLQDFDRRLQPSRK
jgi:hypothetical protein